MFKKTVKNIAALLLLGLLNPCIADDTKNNNEVDTIVFSGDTYEIYTTFSIASDVMDAFDIVPDDAFGVYGRRLVYASDKAPANVLAFIKPVGKDVGALLLNTIDYKCSGSEFECLGVIPKHIANSYVVDVKNSYYRSSFLDFSSWHEGFKLLKSSNCVDAIAPLLDFGTLNNYKHQ